MTMARRIRILPLLIIVAALSFAVRLTEVATGVRSLSGAAMAQEEVEAHPPGTPPSAAEGKEQAEAPPAPGGPALPEKPAAAGPPEPGKEGEARKWQDASEDMIDASEVKKELFEDLARRRADLETREKQLATREALLKAAEQELDQKYRELKVLKKEIEELLQDQSEQEQARITSLVKIYEGMKAKDAARIFDTLDMDVLISVMGRMSERKSSAIMAEMNPERARAVTILLAQQKQLPTLSKE